MSDEKIPIIDEHLRKADESILIYTGIYGTAIWCYQDDQGEIIIFPTMNDFVKRIYFGENAPRKYCTLQELPDLVKHADTFYDINKEQVD